MLGRLPLPQTAAPAPQQTRRSRHRSALYNKKEDKNGNTAADAPPPASHNKFDPDKPVRVHVTAETLAKVAELAQREYIYEASLGLLQIELVKLQNHLEKTGDKVAVIFEGRDAAGKGGVISRIAAAMSPRVCRIVALPKPTDAEKGQWYFQRFASHLPSPGELVLFDRSWYSRAGVEKVMGFATPEQVEHFFQEVPLFEHSLVNAGVKLIKIWLEVSDAEQEKRFQSRLKHSWKRWKLSPMDLFARSKWTEYARARDVMLERTDHGHARWWVVDSDNKGLAHLNTIQHILRMAGPYEDIPATDIILPPRESSKGYVHPDASKWHTVPSVYHAKSLDVPPALLLQAASLQVADLAGIGLDSLREVLPGPERS